MKTKTKWLIGLGVYLGLGLIIYPIANTLLNAWSWDDSIIFVIIIVTAGIGLYTILVYKR